MSNKSRRIKVFDTTIHITFGNITLTDEQISSLESVLEDAIFENASIFPYPPSFISFDCSFPIIEI